MNSPWPRVEFREFLRPNLRPHTLGPEQDANLVGMRWYGQGPFHREFKPAFRIAKKSHFVIRAGDVIYNKLFAWKGAFGVVPEELDGMFVSDKFPTYELDRCRCDESFLRWYFRCPPIWEAARTLSTGSAAVSKFTLNPPRFLDLTISLPPLAEQQRIVARIEELAAEIDEARRVQDQETLEVRQMLLGAFSRVTERAPRKPMREVAPLVRRPVELDALSSYPELGIRSFGKGTFHKPALSGSEIGEKRVFRIEPGDLLFSNVFAWEGAIAVAKPADTGRIGSHRFISCVPNPGVATAAFLCFYFLTDEGLEKIGAASPGWAGRNRTLGLAALESIEVPVPLIHDQRWFNAVQMRLDTMKQLQAETAAELDALLPSILDRAFKGEL